MIKIKRVYEKATEDDGFRILVDRLWPRGLSKDVAKVDLWLKEIAPSNDLRKGFSHDPKKWEEFKKKFEVALREKQELLQRIRRVETDNKVVTLLYSARDQERNNAVALSIFLRQRGKAPERVLS